jgi:mRNA-degrading endonuclease RelE of RelBE toxin-antitoxin system
MDDRVSVRRGTYRVIYRIDDKARVVTVVDIAHRRDVYQT